MGGRNEGGFELGGSEVDPLPQHAAEPTGEPLGVTGLRRLVVDHRGFGEKGSEHRTEPVDLAGDLFPASQLGKPLAKKLLLHYGGGSIKRIGLYDRVVTALRENGIDFVELGGAVPNPRLELVHEGVGLCRREKVDFVLAVGGGSAIDSAKAIALGALYDGDVWDFYMRKAEPAGILGLATILTAPAAGSEMSASSVISNMETGIKQGLTHDLLRPLMSALDPEYCASLPVWQVAAGGYDIMAHVMERYFTNTKRVDLTDRLCEAVLKCVILNLPLAIENPADYDAQAELMWASSIAHNNLLGTGREQDWASHAMSHELSAMYDVTHGAGLSVMQPKWMRYVYTHDVARFAQFASRVFDAEYQTDQNAMALEGIARLERFITRCGLPLTLPELGVKDDRCAELARRCTREETRQVGFFVRLYTADIEKIYHSAL